MEWFAHLERRGAHLARRLIVIIIIIVGVDVPLGDQPEKSSSPRCFMTNPPKCARNELEKSKKIKIAAPRPLSSIYRQVITAQLGIQLAVLAFAQSNHDSVRCSWAWMFHSVLSLCSVQAMRSYSY